ncbi:hypothetical protein A1O3_09292 [Capronia epimyces CBS 606.96]|uniref:Alpha/beta hydrolase fold-3 domain-containing protein n=1 Tax=Capronia epimyces CBS 606.96 TaxID=1182542 RepID=W9XMC2_9EURO|nr:uncharacterized protein A1O3_09292 [Capronia epimyces CBS 606.96]EXJ78131.1 hypothetical protein A1O3_09292 [Capronia epimyces CBS 606.96]
MADFSAYGVPSPEWDELTGVTDGASVKGFAAQGFLDLTGLDEIAETTPDDPAFVSRLEELQRKTDASREIESAQWWKDTGLKEKVSVEDVEIATRDGKSVPARLYRPKAGGPDKKYPVYMFFHGGGFLFGSLTGEDVTCSTIANALQILVVNVCYRHTPQVRYPTPFHDAWDSFEWVSKNIDDFGGDSQLITVGGISAGGGLAAYLTLEENKRAPGAGRIKGQMLGAPWLLAPKLAPVNLLASKEVSAYHQCRDAPVLPASSMALFQALLRQENPTDNYIQVSKDEEWAFKGMPKTAILVAGMDPLRDEALLYGQELEKRGVSTSISIFPGLPHGFRRFKSLPSTPKWDKAHIDAIAWFFEPTTA